MEQLKKNYYIKEGYKCNKVKTFNTKPETYWDSTRVRSSYYFQYSIYKFAAEIFRKKKLKTILDIGSGPGTKMNKLFKGIAQDITLVDQPNMREIIEIHCPGVKYIGWNLEKPIILGEKYDMITCFDVIEHLENPDSILQSVRYNLKENGIAIISTPDRDIRRGKNCLKSPNPEHVREWSRDEFLKYIQKSGFEVLKSFNYPNKKLNNILLTLGGLVSFFIKVPKWYAQVIVIKKNNEK